MDTEFEKIINCPIEMTESNAQISIHTGTFEIERNSKRLMITGRVYYSWLPTASVKFTGDCSVEPGELRTFTSILKPAKLIIDGFEFSDCYITTTNIDSSKRNIHLKGIGFSDAVKGDKTIAVNELLFCVPNLRSFHGLPVKRISSESKSFHLNRLRLENEDFLIFVDKAYNYKELQTDLDDKGGFIIQYGGKLIAKKKSVTYESSQDVVYCLSTFLSFLNGRRTSPLFIQGIFQEEIVWSSYSSYQIDVYKPVITWLPKLSINGVNEIWGHFTLLWKDVDNKSFLISAIHWYIEANKGSGFTEGAIIMAQTALELLYNWIVVENKKILLGKDSESISASNKIRLLLSQMKVTNEVPQAFRRLQKFINDDKSKTIEDAPDAVVQIRNAIVHSQQDKRKKLSSIEAGAKMEALQLCISYIEMSLLYILDYDQEFSDRRTGSIYALETEKLVPWQQ